MTIFEINKALEDAMERAIDPETGEILSDAAIIELNELELARDEKLEGIGMWIKKLRAEAKAIEKEEDALYQRRVQKLSKIESLSALLDYALQGEGFETPRIVMSYKLNPPKVNIINMDELPEMYKRTKVTVEADKTAIKAMIKAGEAVPGAELVQNRSLRIG